MKKYLFVIGFLAALCSCSEQPVGSTPMDGKAPGQVTDVGFNNVSGGADIYYTLPDDDDLLYVKALYTLESGKEVNVRVSMYEDTLRVRGYANSARHEVKIVTGDRSGNESAPVTITITPKRSPIYDILESLEMQPAFGGVTLAWDNFTESTISITLLKRLAGGPWEEVNTYYSNSKIGKQSARGMESEEAEFAVFIRDRWENSTDTVRTTLTPLYEKQLPVGSYKEYKMNGDSEVSYNWSLGYALDGNLTQQYGWFSTPSVEGGTWPARCTIKIAGGAKLSRIRIIQRYPEMWENGNPKTFTVWGSNNPNPDGTYSGWTALKTFTSVKPSGYPSGQYSDEDEYIAKNGEDFEFDAEKIEVYEYYRFEFTENWGGDNTWINLFEILFWGELNQ